MSVCVCVHASLHECERYATDVNDFVIIHSFYWFKALVPKRY